MNTTAALRTMDQQRAEFALRAVDAFARQDKSRQAELRRYLIQLPALIQMNGLGQALAFFRSKGLQSSHGDIYGLIGKWLCEAGPGQVFNSGERDALRAITSSDMFRYMAAQNEALALLEWLKKFAVALLEKED